MGAQGAWANAWNRWLPSQRGACHRPGPRWPDKLNDNPRPSRARWLGRQRPVGRMTNNPSRQAASCWLGSQRQPHVRPRMSVLHLPSRHLSTTHLPFLHLSSVRTERKMAPMARRGWANGRSRRGSVEADCGGDRGATSRGAATLVETGTRTTGMAHRRPRGTRRAEDPTRSGTHRSMGTDGLPRAMVRRLICEIGDIKAKASP